MLREVLDITSLEDFVSGLARAARLRVCTYDRHGELLVASQGNNDFARLTGHVLTRLPANMRLVAMPARDPPASVAFVESRGVWYVVAPISADDQQAGYVAIGEYREKLPPAAEWDVSPGTRTIAFDELRRAWETLPVLERGGEAPPVVTARWAARQIAEWVQRESQLLSKTAEVGLVGDIAALLAGEQDLQSALDHIVAETARVMNCERCSMRLYDAKSKELVLKAVHNLPAEYVRKGTVLRTSSGVDDEALRGRVVQIDDVATDPRVQYPEDAARHGIVSMLTAGMIYRGDPVGVIRVYTNERRRFRKAHRDLLRVVATQAATAIVHVQLVAERLRTAETRRQLALAGELQRRMIRTAPPQHPRLETAHAFHPTFEVAGDFCDFLRLCDGRLAIVVGDVAGKGVPASLLMSSVRAALRTGAAYCAGPGDLLTQLNRQLCHDTLPSEFVTLLLLAIDADARRFTYVSAGHEPLLLLRDGQIQSADEGDLVLGVRLDEVYHEHELALAPRDLLLLCTDGVTEARNFADEEFGRERLWRALHAYGELPTQQVLNNIVWDVRRFVGLADQSDDMTLVAVRVLPS